MEIRLQAMQPLPYHAGLAAHLRRRLPSITALSACSCPLHLSMSGEPLTQKQSSQFLPAVPGIRQCATRRTLALRRPSHVPVVLNVLARRRCPIHALACVRYASSIDQGVAWKKADSIPTDGVGYPDVLPTSVQFHHWTLGFGQCSSHHIVQALQDHAIHVF